MTDRQVGLASLSHPAMDPIAMSGDLISVGREEALFQSTDPEAAGRLSRRHARIFRQGGEIYLADLHSRNGTRLNREPVLPGRALALRNGDEISFGESFSFRVEIEASVETVVQGSRSPPPQLVLEPVDQESILDTIVISDYPFLIARENSVFEAYASRLPEQLSHISRRHAVIVASNDRLLIEDLGSRNGTFLNGEPLGSQRRALETGDSLALGGDCFRYRIAIRQDEQQQLETVYYDPQASQDSRVVFPGDESEPTDPQATMFVDSPTSFLDIFCPGQEHSLGPAGSGGRNTDRKTGRTAGRAGTTAGVRGSLRGAFKALGEASRRHRIAVLALAVALVALLVYTNYSNDLARIRELRESGKFLNSARLANDYLADNDGDAALQSEAAVALMHAILPGYVNWLQTAQISQAARLVDQVQAEFSNLEQGQEYLALLDWITRLEDFSRQRQSWNAPVRIYRDEVKMQALLTDWDSSPTRHQQLLGQLAGRHPEFAPVQKKVLSDLRQLRHDYALYGEAIAQLLRELSAGLEACDGPAMLGRIDAYQRNYPRLAGLDILRDDIATCTKLNQALANGDLGALVTARRKLAFHTELFNRTALPWYTQKLPDQALIASYDESLGAWSQGRAEAAITALQGAGQPPWGEVVDNQIRRFEEIHADYLALAEAAGSRDHAQRLLEFRSRLKNPEDDHFLQATDADFDRLKPQVNAGLAEDLSHARSAWDDYQRAGGISSVVRIEDPVSDHFTSQAGRLSAAHSLAVRAMQTYELLRISPGRRWRQLYDELSLEVKRQRDWIEDLAVVLDPTLVERKLEMLPVAHKE